MKREVRFLFLACATTALATAFPLQAQTMMDRIDPGLRNKIQHPWEPVVRPMTRAEHERGISYAEAVIRSAWDAIGRPDTVEVRAMRMMAFDDPATVFSYCGQIRGPRKGGPYAPWKTFASSVSSLGEVATAVDPDPRMKAICILGDRPSWSDPEVQIERTVKTFNASLRSGASANATS